LLVKRGETYIWIEAGLRRDVYDKAERGHFVVNPNRRFMGFVDTAVPEDERRQPLPTLDRVAQPGAAVGVFDHWTTAELGEAGFSSDEIALLRNCGNEYALLTLPWPEDRIDLAIELVELTPEQWRAGVEAGGEALLRSAIAEFGGLTGISPLFAPDELARIAAAPVEDWMIFLHPDQRAVVERRYDGPARVRGAAGTGKTVVALHRAAHLSRSERNGDGGPVLFTTVTDSLPRVYAHLFSRMPDASVSEVDFLSIDDVAAHVVKDSAVQLPDVDLDVVEAGFEGAFATVVTPSSPLARSALTRDYLRTEITRVLKGRGVESLDEYLTLVRTGRAVGLTASLRTHLWELAEAWDEQCAIRGTIHPGDVLIRALEIASESAGPRYRSIVVDEAQDLTMVGLQLLRALVNAGSRDRPNGLFLVGDGAQRVFPGGFTLRQAGVEVRGRTTVQRVNYRNTQEIHASALAVAGDERVVDLDEEFKRGELVASTVRRGVRPLLFRFATEAEQMSGLVKHIRDIAGSEQIGMGDIAVFCANASACSAVARAFEGNSLAWQLLTSYEGVPSERVKIGTYAEAKGLEFKAVFLPGLSQSDDPAADLDSDEEGDERRALELSRLFVAMTRARDVLILSCIGEPSDSLSRALPAVEVVDP
jgi:hypothetical protein